MSKVHEGQESESTKDYIAATSALAEMARERQRALGFSPGASANANRLVVVLNAWASESMVTVSSPVEAWLRSARSGPDLWQGVERARRWLCEDPLQDGEEHRAALLLARLAMAGGDELVQPLLESLGTGDLETKGALIQCLGRIAPEVALPWALEVVEPALRDPSPRVRGAALKAIESWGTAEAIDLLRRYDDRVEWLAAHARRLLHRR